MPDQRVKWLRLKTGMGGRSQHAVKGTATEDGQLVGDYITGICLLNFDKYFEYFGRRLLMHATGQDDLQDDTVHYNATRDDLSYMFYQKNALILVRDSRAREEPIAPGCPPSCHVAEIATYELLTLLRENHLYADTTDLFPTETVLEAMSKIPNFPFSDRYTPCSDSCIYHRLAALPTFKKKAEELTPPAKLLCLEGYRLNGKSFQYPCNVLKGDWGVCRHCKPEERGCGCCGLCQWALKEGYNALGEKIVEKRTDFDAMLDRQFELSLGRP